TEGDLAFAFDPAEAVLVDEIVAVAVADGNADHFAPGVLARPGRDRVFHFQVHVAADVLQRIVPPHRSRQEAGFEQDLKAVADAGDVAAARGELPDLFHD